MFWATLLALLTLSQLPRALAGGAVAVSRTGRRLLASVLTALAATHLSGRAWSGAEAATEAALVLGAALIAASAAPFGRTRRG